MERKIKINREINRVLWAKDAFVLVVCVARGEVGVGGLSSGTQRAQGLTSEGRPNGKANTVITEVLLQEPPAASPVCCC